MKALIISTNDFEDSELSVPRERLLEKGVKVEIASENRGAIIGKHGKKIAVDKTFDEVDPDDYDIIILPGGKAPQKLRKEPRVLDIVRRFFKLERPIAAICHGPQILISAGLMRGKHATAYRTVAHELKEAGAVYEDKEVVVDKKLITSRQPSDLDAFVREIFKQLKVK